MSHDRLWRTRVSNRSINFSVSPRLPQPHLDATLFGGGLASQDYYLTDEGIQLEQSITEGIGIVGRATGYQLWIEKNSTSPLAPSNHTANRLNFGRFQGGFDLSPVRRLQLRFPRRA